jgi:tetratricopeptide (TPR) repeat protein
MSGGKRLGPYELGAELGRGAAGVVYRALDTRSRREVALKVFLGLSEAGAEAIVRAAPAALHLRHAGIVTVHDVVVVDGLCTVARELVEGEALTARLARGPLAPRDAAALAADLAAAVEAAHRAGILHADLEPGKVLIDRSGRARLTGFCFGRESQSTRQPGGLRGISGYMTPEQARGAVAAIGPRTDVHGLGALLFACLTGEPPFQGESTAALLRRVRREEAPSPSLVRERLGLEALTEDLVTICRRALERAPARRYPTAAALEEDLRRWLDGRPILSRPPGLFARARRGLGRNRKGVALAGALAFAAVLGAARVPGLLERRARARSREAVVAAILAGDERVTRETAVHELAKDGDPEAVQRLAAILDGIADRLFLVTREALLSVVEPRDALEQARQGRLDGLREALDQIEQGDPWDRLPRPRVHALDEARRRLAQRRSRNAQGGSQVAVKRPEAVLADEQRTKVGAPSLLLARVVAESLGLLGPAAASGKGAARALGRYLQAEEDEERATPPAEALGRLRDARAAASVLRLDERMTRGGSYVRKAEDALARGLAGTLPPADPQTALDFLDRGRLRALVNELDGAFADFTRAITLDPKDPYAWALRANLNDAHSRWTEAQADALRAAELDPEDPSPWLTLASARQELGNVEAALVAAERAIELDALDARSWDERGRLRLKKGDSQGGLADLSRAIELDPRNPSPWGNRATHRAKLLDWNGAIEDDTKALSIDPGVPELWNNRAIAKESVGDLEGAIADLSRALELAPKDVAMWLNRAHMRHAKRDFEGAGADATHALELEPRSGRALATRARARISRGDTKGAREDAERAVEVSPDDPGCWNALGFITTANGEYDKAVAALSREIELTPDDSAGWSSRGFARSKTGDTKGAIQDCRHALEISPRDAATWRNLADALLATGDRRGSIEALGHAIDLEPGDLHAWRERALRRFEGGDAEGAIKDATRALSLDERDVIALWIRGYSLKARGAPVAARRDLEKILEVFPGHPRAAEIKQSIEDLKAAAPE